MAQFDSRSWLSAPSSLVSSGALSEGTWHFKLRFNSFADCRTLGFGGLFSTEQNIVVNAN